MSGSIPTLSVKIPTPIGGLYIKLFGSVSAKGSLFAEVNKCFNEINYGGQISVCADIGGGLTFGVIISASVLGGLEVCIYLIVDKYGIKLYGEGQASLTLEVKVKILWWWVSHTYTLWESQKYSTAPMIIVSF